MAINLTQCGINLTQWTTVLSAVLSVPVVGLAAHRNLQRLQVLSRLTPPPAAMMAESKEDTRKPRYIVFGMSVAKVSFVAMLRYAMAMSDLLGAVLLLALIVCPACFALYESYFLPAQWSLTAGPSKGNHVLNRTASDNRLGPGGAKALCFGVTGLVFAGGYVHPQATICVLNVGLLGTFLLATTKVVSTRGVVHLTFGLLALLGVMFGVILALVAFFCKDSDRDKGSDIADDRKPPVLSALGPVILSASHLVACHLIPAYIVLVNLRYDYSRQVHLASEPLPAGESAPIAPLFPLKPLVANPRLFRASFIALVATYAVLYIAFALAGVDTIWWIYGTSAAGAVVAIATSAITAHRLGELSAWWNYREVWRPKVVDADVEHDSEIKADVPDDQKPLLTADSQQ